MDFKGIPEELTGSLQENVLTLAASSDQYCKQVVLNVPLELYSNRVMRDLATQVYNHIHTYGTAPKDHLVDIVEDKLQGENGEVLQQILENIQALLQAGFNEQFVVNQLNRFVQQQELKGAVVGLIESAEKGDVEHAYDLIDKYRKTRIQSFDVGLTLKERAEALGIIDRSAPLFPTGIKEFDKADLGPARGELHLFLGPPKRGKTWWLVHLTKQALLARQRAVYVTLEVSQDIIADRIFQSIFSMTRRDDDEALAGRFDLDERGALINVNSGAVSRRLALTSKAGMTKVKRAYSTDSQIARLSKNLRIQSFPTGSLRFKDLAAYLENLASFDRFVPDVVFLDYADLMFLPIQQYRLALGLLYKELRGLAVENNCAMVTASQTNRASLDVPTITEKHAAEDLSKIAIADVAITYNQTQQEREVQAARLHVAVARNSKDKWHVCITQGYSIGQFCTGSMIVPAATWQSRLPKPVQAGTDEDEEHQDD